MWEFTIERCACRLLDINTNYTLWYKTIKFIYKNSSYQRQITVLRGVNYKVRIYENKNTVLESTSLWKFGHGSKNQICTFFKFT